MKHTLAIDLGGTIVKIGLVAEGKVIARTRLNADSQTGLASMLPAIGDAIDGLLEQQGIGKQDLAGAAMAFPGIVDFAARRAASTNAKYNDAPDVDVEGWIMDRYEIPFVMDNDARMALLGEWTCGAGRGTDNMVMMTIGTGIGTGAVIDGRPLYGRRWCAGALGGHMIVDWRGRRCTCGNIGCVEAHSASFFLPQIIGEDEGLSEAFRADKGNYNFKTLFDKYRAGDPDAVRVVTGCMDVWAAAIVNFIHAYDPEKVVIGGGVIRSADIIIPYVQQRVNSLAWTPGEKVTIVPSELGDDAALVAAEYYFNVDHVV